MKIKPVIAAFLAGSIILAPSALADDIDDDSTSEVEHDDSNDDINDNINDDINDDNSDDISDDSIDDSYIDDDLQDDSDNINDDIVIDEDLPDSEQLYGGSAWIVATNNLNKKVWVVKVGKNGRMIFTVPTEYSDWNISINYRIKKKYADGKRVFSKGIN